MARRASRAIFSVEFLMPPRRTVHAADWPHASRPSSLTVANWERVGGDMVSPTTMTSGGYILHGPVVGAAREAR